MDNASNHSRKVNKLPVKSWTKKKLITLMDSKSISYLPMALKLTYGMSSMAYISNQGTK
jgi:hypothetical protein